MPIHPKITVYCGLLPHYSSVQVRQPSVLLGSSVCALLCLFRAHLSTSGDQPLNSLFFLLVNFLLSDNGNKILKHFLGHSLIDSLVENSDYRNFHQPLCLSSKNCW